VSRIFRTFIPCLSLGATRINAFSPNFRQIMERFEFGQQVLRMTEKNILYVVVKSFADPKIDLSHPTH